MHVLFGNISRVALSVGVPVFVVVIVFDGRGGGGGDGGAVVKYTKRFFCGLTVLSIARSLHLADEGEHPAALHVVGG